MSGKWQRVVLVGTLAGLLLGSIGWWPASANAIISVAWRPPGLPNNLIFESWRQPPAKDDPTLGGGGGAQVYYKPEWVNVTSIRGGLLSNRGLETVKTWYRTNLGWRPIGIPVKGVEGKWWLKFIHEVMR
jgi:hypothetical protein